MHTNKFLWSTDGRNQAATRRHFLRMAATVAVTAPLAGLAAGGTAQAAQVTPGTAPRRIGRAVLVPRFGADATADWYPTALRQLTELGISTRVVSLLPAPSAPGINETVAAVNMDLNFASIASAAGPITVHLSDNDPYTGDWRANAADWLGKLGAAVHIAHGAGHYMTISPGPVLDTIRVASYH